MEKKSKMFKKMSIYGVSAASVLATSLWLKKLLKNEKKFKYYPVSRTYRDADLGSNVK